MAAVALALAASLAWGSSDFLAGIKSRSVAVLSVLVVSQAAGLVLVLAGIALASLECSEDAARPWRATAGLGLALLAALGFGAFFVGMDRASDGGILWAVALNRGASLALLVVFAAGTRRRVGVARADGPAVIGVGTLDIAANVLFAAALTFGLTGMVAVLGSMYPVTTVLLARVVLHDRIARRQELGVVGALTGVALVTVAA